MIVGDYMAKRTGIITEIRVTTVNSEPVYFCKINNKIYKFSEQEFKEKWKLAPPNKLVRVQEKLL